MTKFTDVTAEAAYIIAGEGFAEEFGNVETTAKWNALCDVNHVTLRNIGENELADRFKAEHGENTITVWVQADSDGFVSTIEHSSNFAHCTPQDVERKYRAAEELAEWTDANDAYEMDI